MSNEKHTNFRVKNQTFSLLFAISCALGIYFAYRTANQYDIYIRAILGVTVIFSLIAMLSSKAKIEEPAEIQLELPKDLRYFAYGFLIAALFFWSLVQVFSLVKFLFF
jgi:amino acid transporter